MISKKGRGGRRYLPYAFTEQGVAMLSSILRSERAVQVNIEIMRAFIRLRELMATHRDLVLRLNEIEQKYDAQFRVVFDAIWELMTPPESRKRKIGFLVKNEQGATEEDRAVISTFSEFRKRGSVICGEWWRRSGYDRDLQKLSRLFYFSHVTPAALPFLDIKR